MNKNLKNFVVLTIGIFIALHANSQTNWKFLTKNSLNEYFVDTNSISGVEDQKRISITQNLLKPRGEVNSYLVNYQINCNTNEYTMISATSFTEQGLKGVSQNLTVSKLTRTAEPNSAGSKFVEAACQKSNTGGQTANLQAKPEKLNVDAMPIPKHPPEFQQDQFLNGFLLDQASWQRAINARNIRKMIKSESQDQNEMRMEKISSALSARIKQNELKDSDDYNLKQQKIANLNSVAFEYYELCKNSTTKSCKFNLPEVEEYILARFTDNQNDFNFFLKDAVKRYKELYEQYGDIRAAARLSNLLTRFVSYAPDGINYFALDTAKGSYVPIEYDLNLGFEYGKKVIRAGDLYDECGPLLKSLEKNKSWNFEEDVKRVGALARVCQYNYSLIENYDPEIIDLKKQGKPNNTEYYAKLVADKQAWYSRFMTNTAKFPFTVKVTCTVGSDETFFKGCFRSKVGTMSALQVITDGKTANFNIQNDFGGGNSPTAFYVYVTKGSKLIAQKAAESPLVMNVYVLDSRTGKVLKTQSANDQFQTLTISN